MHKTWLSIHVYIICTTFLWAIEYLYWLFEVVFQEFMRCSFVSDWVLVLIVWGSVTSYSVSRVHEMPFVELLFVETWGIIRGWTRLVKRWEPNYVGSFLLHSNDNRRPNHENDPLVPWLCVKLSNWCVCVFNFMDLRVCVCKEDLQRLSLCVHVFSLNL